jgi:hypothetical protein
METGDQPIYFERPLKELSEDIIGRSHEWIKGRSPSELSQKSAEDLMEELSSIVRLEPISVADAGQATVEVGSDFEGSTEKTRVTFILPASGPLQPLLQYKLPLRAQPSFEGGTLETSEGCVRMVYKNVPLDSRQIMASFERNHDLLLRVVAAVNKEVEEINRTVRTDASQLLRKRKDRATQNERLAEALRQGIADQSGSRREEPKEP